MKLLALATTALLSTSVAARSSLFGVSVGGDISPNVDGELSVPGDNPLNHCADPSNDILKIENVDISPNPPKAGQTLTVTAKGILNQNVTEGAQIHLSVKYGLITIIRQTSDLCNLVKNVDLECPLSKDKETSLSKEVHLPKEIPPGKYTVMADVVAAKVEGEDVQKKITCLTAVVEFKRGGAVVFKQGL
ncbi:hypothetical protein LTR62_008892 [Meristemomyces frigidus]|uniref:Phosphatidylglycerol/phosphatidylinositol transfer protein n=1 Tax=Meristemomyces frigidus TaxID=1508187 RepID=A0AAN7TA61_9PEZI|nr:hypothetical protein LTR62_008892 [Meristemomyces frigidus]